MENTPVLTTPRLLLRRFCEADADALFSLLRDPAVNAFLPMFAPRTLQEAQRYLREEYLQSYARPSGFRYAVCLREGGAPIGYLRLGDEESHDLGYALQRAVWGRGFAAEAAGALLAHLPYVTATHDVRNPASGRVMQKLGMRYQYSYDELWQPKNRLVTFRLYQCNLDGDEGRVFRGYWDRYPVHFIEPLAADGPARDARRAVPR